MATVASHDTTNTSNMRMVIFKLTSCTSAQTVVSGLTNIVAMWGTFGSTASTPYALELTESAGTITFTYAGGSAGNDTIYLFAIGS